MSNEDTSILATPSQRHKVGRMRRRLYLSVQAARELTKLIKARLRNGEEVQHEQVITELLPLAWLLRPAKAHLTTSAGTEQGTMQLTVTDALVTISLTTNNGQVYAISIPSQDR